MRSLPLVQRFEAQVIKTDGCWFWQGGLNSQGYGQFPVFGRQVPAHRFAYDLYRGQLDNFLTIDHLCRNPICVNPDHMEQVTAAENKSRTPKHQPLRGIRYDLDKSPIARRRVEAGMSRDELAAKAGVSTETVVNVELGKHRPRLTTLKALATALGVSIEDVLSDIGLEKVEAAS